MKKFIIVTLLVLIANNAIADRLIEGKYHHIGDTVMFGFLIPEPEALHWSGTFTVKDNNLEKNFAFLSFLAHTHGVEIFVNGNRINYIDDGLDTDLGLEKGASSKFSKYIISVPMEYLQLGINTVEFSARQMDDGYDDSEFGKVRILFQ